MVTRELPTELSGLVDELLDAESISIVDSITRCLGNGRM